jgi:hypothetical protein
MLLLPGLAGVPGLPGIALVAAKVAFFGLCCILRVIGYPNLETFRLIRS